MRFEGGFYVGRLKLIFSALSRWACTAGKDILSIISCKFAESFIALSELTAFLSFSDEGDIF